MHVRVVERPIPFMSLERVKQHLNIEADDSDFDDLVKGYVASAVAWLDGPEGWLGQCLGEQVLEMAGDAFPSRCLPYGPVLAVESIAYMATDGTEVTMPEGDYRLLASGQIYAETWPSLGSGPEAVRIRWRAGYADQIVPPADEGGEPSRISTVPEPVQLAILLLVGQWFKTRENVVTGTIATAVPFAVDALLSPYRVWR